VLYRSKDLTVLAINAGEPVRTVPVMELAPTLNGDGGLIPTGEGMAPRSPTSVEEMVNIVMV
jgi:hypothetical protein